ncbi:MAG: DEAD/DEAH box helicase [Gammaproteobacteria bacterium]|nr:DEAD/DEAH box helicase [Gammaproteobacteria bacterium]
MKFLKRMFQAPETDAEKKENQPDEQAASAQTAAREKPKQAPANPSGAKDKPKAEPGGRQHKSAPDDRPVPPDFAELDLPDEINRAVMDLGFTSCTPVQKEVLPHLLDGKDIIAQAQTGTGKTAAFLISVITYHLENPENEPRAKGTPFALAIAPTRELAMQIAADAEDLSAHTDFGVCTLVGGIDYDKQRKQLQGSVDIVVATPGRLLDFARSKTVDLSRVEILILDEADRMLSMGFIPDVKSIIRLTPRKENRQTQLFSATFSEDIRRLADQWTVDPIRTTIDPEQVAVDSIEQRVDLTSGEDKYKVLYNLIRSDETGRVIVFANRRDETRKVADRLYRNGIECGLLTGDVPQKKRISTLDKFKSGETPVLVATDVAGRGIHVDDISHVVNYNLPEDPEDYVHRIGRTGRAGNKGISIALAGEDDAFMLPAIEALLGKPMTSQPPPENLMADPPPYEREAPSRSGLDSRGKSGGGKRPPQRRRR